MQTLKYTILKHNFLLFRK